MIEKIMSMTEREFADGCRRLAGPVDRVDGLQAIYDVGEGKVTVRFEALPGVILGGLLALPRASVTLTFSDVTQADSDAFVRRFDQAFQRGGG